MTAVRPPAVAGFFYPADTATLSRDVDRYMSARTVPTVAAPKAIIVPHAGYVYSAAVAGPAFAQVQRAAGRINRVVLLGPGHRVAIPGVAAPTADAFQTPLGTVPLERSSIDAIASLPHVELRDDAHREEHCLEVQLPFLQRALGNFTLVPLVVGGASPEQLADILDRLWGGPETLIVISSDLSHYHDYASAQNLDTKAAEAIESLKPDDLSAEQACGRLPIAGMLMSAQRHKLSVDRLDLCNSGDTGGPRDRVVGYGAWAFRETNAVVAPEPLDRRADPQAQILPHAKRLLRSASSTLRYAVRYGKAPQVDLAKVPTPLRPTAATFVTLGSKLRGCIGTVEPKRSLVVDVVENTFSAGFKDPRFSPLTYDELTDLSISISLISPVEKIEFTDEEDLVRQLRRETDGLLIQSERARGLFLPQVWIDLQDPREFLDHLKKKAGIDRPLRSSKDQASRFMARSLGKVVLNAAKHRMKTAS
jgi:AmmeMemoRadiSam system protein B/AmmeMemoRadiSam system protein A